MDCTQLKVGDKVVVTNPLTGTEDVECVKCEYEAFAWRLSNDLYYHKTDGIAPISIGEVSKIIRMADDPSEADIKISAFIDATLSSLAQCKNERGWNHDALCFVSDLVWIAESYRKELGEEK